MMITPFAPLAPYKAAAEASLSTLILCTSLLFIALRLPSKGTPSIIISGLLEALIEPIPRMRTVAPEPGSPDPEVI